MLGDGLGELPGNVTGTGPRYAAPSDAFIAGGAGPGVPQASSARGSLARGILAGAVPQGRAPGATDDVPSPQRIVTAPGMAQLLASTNVGDDTAAQSLPGRIYPSSWDGEPGYGAPGVTG